MALLCLFTLDCQSGSWKKQSSGDGGIKAWVNFDGTTCTSSGQWCFIRSTFNVSAVIAIGSGSSTKYAVHFQTPLGYSSYVVNITADSWWKDSYGHSQVCGLSYSTTTPQTSSSFEFDCSYQDSNNNAMYAYPVRTGMITVFGY